jgi:hypothetical protein
MPLRTRISQVMAAPIRPVEVETPTQPPVLTRPALAALLRILRKAAADADATVPQRRAS